MGSAASSAAEGAAQAADVDVDGAGLDVDVRAPDRVEQLLAREHAAGVLHEVVEQAKLGGAQVHVLAGALHPVGGAVDDDVAVADAVFGQARADAAQHGADAGARARSSGTA